MKKRIGNIMVDVTNKNDAVNFILNRIKEREKTDVHFLNDHAYNIAQKDENFLHILNNSDLLLNDGIGVELGAKFYGFSFEENLNGTDFTPYLFQALNNEKEKTRVFLLGSKEGIAKKAIENLQEQYPNLLFVGEHHGYFDHKNSKEIIKKINDKETDLLLVGFGMPLQEKWIEKNRNELNCSVTMSIGAFIDFSSGDIKRAPEIYRKFRLEWLYRFTKEPKRLWKRNLGHFSFLYYLIKDKRKKL